MTAMTKVARFEVLDDRSIRLVFSDGTGGVYDFSRYFGHESPLTTALRDPAYFRNVYVDEGALAWPNGLDFSGWKLQRDLDEAGRLERPAMVSA